MHQRREYHRRERRSLGSRACHLGTPVISPRENAFRRVLLSPCRVVLDARAVRELERRAGKKSGANCAARNAQWHTFASLDRSCPRGDNTRRQGIGDAVVPSPCQAFINKFLIGCPRKVGVYEVTLVSIYIYNSFASRITRIDNYGEAMMRVGKFSFLAGLKIRAFPPFFFSQSSISCAVSLV